MLADIAMENNLGSLQKIRSRTLGDGDLSHEALVQPLSAMHLKEMKGPCRRDTHQPLHLLHYFHKLSEPKCPSWLKMAKKQGTHKHMLFSRGILSFATWTLKKIIIVYKLS